MNDDCDPDPIRVAGDDGEILGDGSGGESNRTYQYHLTIAADRMERLNQLYPDATSATELIRRTVDDAIRTGGVTHAAGDGGDGGNGGNGGNGVRVRCPNGHEFGHEERAAATFDGTTACWQCPECGEWVEAPPP